MTNDKYRHITQLVDKPFEEMTIEELYQEQVVHKWHRTQMKYHIERLKKRKWWLENNKPILSKEEINEKYENGEMTEKQYKTAFACRKNAIRGRLRLADYMNYAYLVAENEDAIATYLEELTAQKKSARDIPKRQPPTKKYDPRKNVSVNNRPPWQKQLDAKEIPRLRSSRRRWHKFLNYDLGVRTASAQMQSIMAWDFSKLMEIARDRGYFTDVALVVTVSEALDLTMVTTRKLLNNGKFSWGQCIAIGALFEMTPKEFCDVFLSGYFQETADGVYKAHIDDIPAFLAQGKKKQATVDEVMLKEEVEEDE